MQGITKIHENIVSRKYCFTKIWSHTIFIEHWNGIALLWNSRKQSLDTTVFTDASGWGSHWLQLQWPSCLQDLSITVKKVIPVVLAAATFGP